MPLVLTIVRQPEGANVAEARKLFTEAGGTLGRAGDNNWSLPDPSRFVSSHHASIRYDQGDFYLVDTSTNGVYVNSSNNPLGTGNQVRLQQGDKLVLGDYEINVEFEQAENASSMGADDFDQWLEPENTDASDVGGDMGDLLTPEQELLDPLAALDKASGSASDAWQGSSQADNAAIPDQAFVPPAPIPEQQAIPAAPAVEDPGMIPDDWDIDDLLSGKEPEPAPPPPPPPVPEVASPSPIPEQPMAPAAQVEDDFDAFLEGPDAFAEPPSKAEIDSDELDAFLGLDEADDLAIPEPAPVAEEPVPVLSQTPASAPDIPAAPESPAADAAPAIPEPPQPPAPQVPVPPSAIEPAVSQPAVAPMAAPTCDDLIRSLGLDPARMNDDTRNHFQALLADTLKETVAGMMQVLGARNAIKNEFRMSVTMIQPRENNPLKFSPNVEEALRNMFASESNAYLPGTVAIKDGFQDIADHQVSVIAGMRAAFRSLLKRFDPAELQVRFDKQQQTGGFLSSKKGKYWEAYGEFYNDLSNNMDDAFQELFGEDFAEAYEQQMSRLEAARKK